ncbi:MAG: STAS domain-containing protein [Hyphomicrobiales bacterium]
MKINTIDNGSSQIIELKGRLDTSNFNVFEDVINDLIEKGKVNLIIDCHMLNYISSSGLRIFLVGYKRVKPLGGVFYVCNLQENIYEVFKVSGFTSIFTIYPDRNDALKAFSV